MLINTHHIDVFVFLTGIRSRCDKRY